MSTLPFLREPNGNIAVLPYLTTWCACGFLAGLLVPDRPWHWGLAMAIGQPIAHIVLDPKNGVWELVLIPLLPVVAAPIVAGAYLGRLVSPGPVTIPARPTRPIPSASSSQLLVLFAIGFVVSFVVAYASVAWFMAYVRKRGFAPFAVYRIIVGVLVLAFAAKLAQ